MTNSDDDSTNGTQFQAGPLIISAVMVGAGTLVALAGLTVGATYVISVARRRIQEMEVPPSELARIKWTQAKAAVSAGASAWQNGTQTSVTSATSDS
jgi:hypothetical protein